MERMYERNWGFIPEDLQEKIETTKLLFVGCGAASQIALLAARAGFTKFILLDGDKVTLSNLNRQAFFSHQLGQNKAQVLKELILGINPNAKVTAYPEFLVDAERVAKEVKKADIILNSADPEEPLWTIHYFCRKEQKVEIQILNMGWLAYAIVFTPQTPSLEEIVGGKVYGVDLYMRLATATMRFLPKKFIDFLSRYSKKIERRPFPQLGPTVLANAAQVVTAMIRIVMGDPTLPVAPKALTIDLFP